MILEFSVANFLSFKDKVTFSMLANASNSLSDNFVNIVDKKVLKTAVVYGANASGKSNLFQVLEFVNILLKGSNDRDINSKLLYKPFRFNEKSIKKPSMFEIKFIVNNIEYVYGFSYDIKKIYEEYLYYYPNGRIAKIFDRVNTNEYSYSQKDYKFLKDIEAKNASNKFFLTTATNWNYEKTKPAYDFLTTGICTLFDMTSLRNMAFNIYAHEDKKLRDFTLDFLKKADFNIVDYKVLEHIVQKELLESIPDYIKNKLPEIPKAFQVLFKHKGSNEYLDFGEESLGTQMVFMFLPFIVDSFNNKKVLIIDELDKSLHPFLVNYIVNIFNDYDVNKSGSQLIFNTHDTNLLDLHILRRDQIWFTEKDNDNGESDLYSLADFKVRKSENIEKGYLLGRYGAIPFIQNDINIWDEE